MTITKARTSWVAGAVLAASLPFMALPDIAAAQQEGPAPLQVFFDLGSSRIKSGEADTLDQAARLFREGNPIVMIVAGGADTVGNPDKNLDLSLRRAQSVADGLVARGIPVERLQVLGRGNSELAVETEDDVPEQNNRVVEISWR